VKLTFLGTGTSQGVPVIACQCRVCQSQDQRDKRLRTSALLCTDSGRRILFDIGPDFRQQMLRHKVSGLEAILVTHAHRDHVAGLDDVRSFNYLQHKNMDVYLNYEAKIALLRDYKYIFEYHQYPGLPEADLHEVGDKPFEAAGETVIPIQAMHKDLPILGYRIGAFAYITDANHIDPEELDKLNGLKVLVINALRKEKHFSHYSLPEALEVIEKLKPEHAYITHISHEMGLHAEVSEQLPPRVSLAFDGLEVNI
jgi:phosphoribosyl 1,2-cyclic phosphate phosphodiesterase